MLSYLTHICWRGKHHSTQKKLSRLAQEICRKTGEVAASDEQKETAKTAKWAQMNSKPRFAFWFSYEKQVILSDNCWRVYAPRVRPGLKPTLTERKAYKMAQLWWQKVII